MYGIVSCLFISKERSSKDLFQTHGLSSFILHSVARVLLLVLEKVHGKEEVKFSSNSGKLEQDIINAPDT